MHLRLEREGGEQAKPHQRLLVSLRSPRQLPISIAAFRAGIKMRQSARFEHARVGLVFASGARRPPVATQIAEDSSSDAGRVPGIPLETVIRSRRVSDDARIYQNLPMPRETFQARELTALDGWAFALSATRGWN